MEDYLKMPTGHSDQPGSDPNLCPHVQMLKKQGKTLPKSSDKLKYQEADNSDSETDSEEEAPKPQGGCPVLNAGQAKDPKLEYLRPGYNVPYISPLKSLLGFKGFLDLKGDVSICRDVWNSYPTYLKHTVFYTNKDYRKARALEIGHRIFLLDKFKSKGNKYYLKKKYTKAISMYEKALSFLQWLDCDVSQTYDPFSEFANGPAGQDPLSGRASRGQGDTLEESDLEELMTRFKVDSDVESMVSGTHSTSSRQKEATPQGKQPEKEIDDEKHFDTLLLTTFHDSNVTLFDGAECTRDTEKDMRNSMLLTLFLSIASCYMNLHHYSEARKLIELGKKIAPTNSIVLFRSAVCTSSNLESSLADLETSRLEIEMAIENKKTEKLFQHEKGILTMLGFQDHEASFAGLQFFIENRIKEVKLRRLSMVERGVARVAQLNRIEAQIIAEGKVPEEGPLPFRIFGNEDEDMEHFIINEMLRKYLYVMDFFIESQDNKQFKKAKKEFLMHKEIVEEFNFYWKFDEEEYASEIAQLGAKNSIDFSDQKYKDRLHRSMKEKGYEIFESGKFNLELFQYIVKEYFEKREQSSEQGSSGMFGSDLSDEEGGFLNVLSQLLGFESVSYKNFGAVLGGGLVLMLVILLGYFAMHASNFIGSGLQSS